MDQMRHDDCGLERVSGAPMTFNVSGIDSAAWEHQLKKADSYALTQDWTYGDAKTLSDKVDICRVVISDDKGQPIALAQLLIKKIGLFLKIAKLTRGPVLLGADLYEETELERRKLLSIEALRGFSIRRLWVLFYIYPEIHSSAKLETDVERLGFKRTNEIKIGSAILNLTWNDEQIFSNLNGKWRNLLRKAMKEGSEVQKFNGAALPTERIVSTYNILKAEKNFTGISNNLLQCMLTSPTLSKNIYAYMTFECRGEEKAGKAPSGLLIAVDHGQVCSYLIGYSDADGRRKNVNYLLLWEAILDAKGRGQTIFDLGGLNENTPPGIARFKRGLNGAEYELLGGFRRVFKFK